MNLQEVIEEPIGEGLMLIANAYDKSEGEDSESPKGRDASINRQVGVVTFCR